MKLKILTLLLILSNFLFPQSAYEIVKKSQEVLYSKSSYIEMTMTVIKPKWQRKMSMKVWALEPDYALIYITEPARDRGTVTLKRKNEIWNWLPSVQKVIKIPPSMMNQSWMGSDFTNDDLVRASSYLDDYTHKLIGEENINGYDCYKIESIPKPKAGVVWGKVVSYISKDGFMLLKTEFYDEENQLIKIFMGSDIKKFGNKRIPTHWEMTPIDKPGNKTVLDYNRIEFDINIDESFFSLQNMTRVR